MASSTPLAARVCDQDGQRSSKGNGKGKAQRAGGVVRESFVRESAWCGRVDSWSMSVRAGRAELLLLPMVWYAQRGGLMVQCA
jgi:hypothetical protein